MTDSYSMDGWQERLDDPGTTLPSQPPLVKADPTAVWLVSIVAVIVLCTLVGWWIVVTREVRA